MAPTPPIAFPSRRFQPCSRPRPPVPRRRPAGSWPRSRRSSSSWPPAPAAPVPRRWRAARTAIATAAPTATPLPTPTATPVPAFPATLKDDEGTSVTIASEPKRIVSLTPATTEILFGLGAGDRVVATDDGSDYPAAAANLKHVATFSSRRHREGRRSWAPTSSWPAASASHRPTRSPSCARSGSRSWSIYAPSVDGVLKDIELIGDAVGAADEAKTMTDGMSTPAEGDLGRSRGEGDHRRARSRASTTRSATRTRPARSTPRRTSRSSPRW